MSLNVLDSQFYATRVSLELVHQFDNVSFFVVLLLVVHSVFTNVVREI